MIIIFNQLQDAELLSTNGGAIGPTSLEFEAFAAAREQGVYLNECSATWSEWTNNYIQTYGTPEQLEEIAERDRRNEVIAQNMSGSRGALVGFPFIASTISLPPLAGG